MAISPLVAQANSRYLDGEYQAAIQCFSEIINNASSPAAQRELIESLLGRSACYHSINNDMAALDDALRAIEVDPNDPRGYFRKGVALFNLNEYISAQLAFETGSRISTETNKFTHLQWDFWIRKAIAEANQEPSRLASSSTTATTAPPASSVEPPMFLTEKTLGAPTRRATPAASSSDVAASLRDDKFAETPSSASTQSTSSQPPTAPTPAPELSPAAKQSQIEQLKKKGNDFFGAKNYREAIAQYSAAIALDPTNAVLYSNRAAAFHELHWHQRALEDAQKTVELDPTSIKGYWRLGSLHLVLRNFTEARNALTKGLAIDPNNASLKQKLVICQFSARYPEISGEGGGDLVEPDGARLTPTRVYEIVRQNLAFIASEPFGNEISRTRRALKDRWVITGKGKVSPVGLLSSTGRSFTFDSGDTTVRILCVVSETEQTYSYSYNKPEDEDESINPSLRRMSTAVVLSHTQQVVLEVTFAEIKRSCKSNANFNPFLLPLLKPSSPATSTADS
jgi:tetratricopeptide (TPR) repeat protein